jgi:hypothetical protein
MVDHEVAQILADIKRRVGNAQERPLAASSVVAENSAASIAPASSVNGFASLSVMARAWDRLPPVVSNRTGTLVRLELWIKEKLRAAFRWFTWEQINFNSATYQTLLEVVESLKAYEQQFAELRHALDEQREAQREELQELSSALSSLTTRIEQIDRQHLTLIAQLNARLEGVSQLTKDQHANTQAETQARLAEMMSESRVRDEQLIDEQRVCYKQLSLELSEARVLEDRARRELEARLARLETEK